jgi:hypothetical protein
VEVNFCHQIICGGKFEHVLVLSAFLTRLWLTDCICYAMATSRIKDVIASYYKSGLHQPLVPGCHEKNLTVTPDIFRFGILSLHFIDKKSVWVYMQEVEVARWQWGSQVILAPGIWRRFLDVLENFWPSITYGDLMTTWSSLCIIAK